MLHDGSTLTHTGANSWDVVQKSDGDKRTFTFKNTYTAGDTALVELEITDKHPTQTLLIRMRLEKDEWRIQDIGQWQAADVAQELLRTERRMEQSDPVQPAAAALRTMNTALLTYYVTYESQGFPTTLQALSSKENDPMTPDHAGLLDPSYLQEPVIKAGYEFRYMRLDNKHYQITATPSNPSANMKSLFTDETTVIRATTEARPANAGDPPLQK